MPAKPGPSARHRPAGGRRDDRHRARQSGARRRAAEGLRAGGPRPDAPGRRVASGIQGPRGATCSGCTRRGSDWRPPTSGSGRRTTSNFLEEFALAERRTSAGAARSTPQLRAAAAKVETLEPDPDSRVVRRLSAATSKAMFVQAVDVHPRPRSSSTADGEPTGRPTCTSCNYDDRGDAPQPAGRTLRGRRA